MVIRSRFDIEYLSEIIDPIILYNKDKYLFTPYIYSYDLAGDIIAISNSLNIDKYCDLFLNLDSIYKANCPMNPHNILKYWLDKEFKKKWCKYNINVELNRCRQNCGELVCESCHPENISYNKEQK